MIPLAVVMLDEFDDGAPKMGPPDRNQPIEAFFLNRPYEPPGVCIGVRGADRRDDHPDSRIPQNMVDVWAPFRIAVTDQHVRRPKQSLVRVRQLTDDLAHEHGIRVGCRSENLDAPRGKVVRKRANIKHRVITAERKLKTVLAGLSAMAGARIATRAG